MTVDPGATAEKWNVLAIVGFAASYAIPPVGAILSFVALSQIKRTGERGRTLARLGAIFGISTTILIAFSLMTGSGLLPL